MGRNLSSSKDPFCSDATSRNGVLTMTSGNSIIAVRGAIMFSDLLTNLVPHDFVCQRTRRRFAEQHYSPLPTLSKL